MATGSVKWFNDAKGFGFITPEGGGDDIFIHFSAIVMEGYKTLKPGTPVSYELVNGPKGLLAQNICPLSLPVAHPLTDTVQGASLQPATSSSDFAVT
jgi:cold shock protein